MTSFDGESSELVTSVRVDSAIYSLDVVKRAAYRFTGTCSVEITAEDGGFQCRLRFPAGVSASSAEAIAERFRIEILDQDLRNSIAMETASVRNAVLALAFSRTGLMDGE